MDNSTKGVSDVNGGEAVPGDTLQYTITVTNSGVTSADNVVVIDTLESNLSYVSGSTTPVPSSVTPALTWNVGSLSTGVSETFSFKAVIASPISDGTTLTNRGWITYNSSDVNGLYKVVTALIDVSSRPRISLVKAVSHNSAAPGDTLTYTLTYLNYGTDNATSVIVADFVPENTAYVANSAVLNSISQTDASDDDGVTVSGSSMIISVGTVTAGDSGQVEFKVRVK
jgi:large repetitive protein